jgi:hypothetical protein
MLEGGFVRVYRSILKWEWYDDANTMRVFLHLILTANWKPKKWHGKVVQRGQRVYSESKLAKELRLSRQEVRTAVAHLISTGEVTKSTTPKYSMVTVKNYDAYQQLTNCQPSINQVPPQKSTNRATKCEQYSNPHESLENQDCFDKHQPTEQPTANQVCTQKSTTIEEIKKEESNKRDKGQDIDIMRGAEKISPPRRQRKIFIKIILNDKSLYPVYEDQIPHWKELYPAVNVEQELRNMAGWCEDNPQRRKTRNGVAKFIGHWLKKTQDRGGNNGYGEKPSSGDNWKGIPRL